MGMDLERLKHCIPLLEYLQQHNWTARSTGISQEFAGLCPLHRDARPSFYVNARRIRFLLAHEHGTLSLPRGGRRS
jgi:DNA primase